jgi:type I restriction enzyme R subunit
MQAIARANRISEGKINGLIVDYIETYTSLLDALAIYGSGGEEIGEGNSGESEPPVKPKEELVHLLEEVLESTETFLIDEVSFNLEELINTSGLEKLAAIQKGINAVYTNDETILKFQVLAREVFKRYKALQPDKILNKYASRKNAINVIYVAIENNVESADVAEIMRNIQSVVDESIESMVSEPTQDYGKIIDLSGLNFQLLEQHFLKSENKNSIVHSLKEKIEKQLQKMVERNPFRVDFYQRYQEIIDSYNRGKDSVTIEDTFKKLLEFVNSLSAEEADTKREGLTEEQKAIFDILRKPNLTESDKKKIKEVSIELLEDLKKEKLRVEQWTEKSVTAAAVFNTVSKTLFESLPYPTYQTNEIDLKTQLVYEHLKHQYYGGGTSIYGAY